MKQRKPMPVQYLPKAEREKENVEVDLSPCITCGKTIPDGYYGRWNDGGTCGKSCELKQSKLPKYPEHTEEQFFSRLLEVRT